MDIYEFAMQMEKEGEDYYRALAKDSASPGLVKIFTMLADEEVKHFKVIESLKRKDQSPLAAKTDILQQVKNVFMEMRDTREYPRIDATKATQEYSKACAIEKNSQAFYQEKAEQAEEGHIREIFQRLAKEEARHLAIMENIVEFVSRPEPGNWLENAEFHHLEEY
ncbi:MAG: ferritin family protein [bacterium]|nr:ferritin family protein [bacterium]